MWLEPRVLLTGTLQNPVQIAIGAVVPGSLAVGGTDFYQIQPGSDGRLIAQTFNAASGLQLRLSIYDGQGNLLVQSDGQSAGHLNPLIDQHVAAGNDILEVQSLSGSGTYSLFTSLTPASDPSQTLGAARRFPGKLLRAADRRRRLHQQRGHRHRGAGRGSPGDRRWNVSGSQRTLRSPTPVRHRPRSQSATSTAITTSTWPSPLAQAIASRSRWATATARSSRRRRSACRSPACPYAILAGDFGNGQTDLAVAITNTGGATDDIVVLMGNGDGTFTQSSPIAVGLTPDSIAMGEFGQNGHFLAVADINSGDVTILTNQGGGSFSATQTIQLPGFAAPTSIVAGDFGTGNLDLAVTDQNTNEVYILKGKGDGTFRPQPSATLAVGVAPTSIVAGDFGNGHLDLAVADAGSNDIAVLLGNGNGTFQAAIQSPTTAAA